MNIKLTLTFNGAQFYGWQSQKNNLGIQNILESALEKIYKQTVKVTGCSRTDRYVNAINYVVNFHPPFFIHETNLKKAITLPKSIKIKNVEYVDEDFHARFNAKYKIYIYRVSTAEVVFDDFCLVETHQLDLEKMKQAAKIFKGNHDFTAFSILNDKNPECEIFNFKIHKKAGYIYFVIKGDRFLHKMVRFLVGGILDVGKKKLTLKNLEENLVNKQRIYPIKPVAGNGLFLKKVCY